MLCLNKKLDVSLILCLHLPCRYLEFARIYHRKIRGKIARRMNVEKKFNMWSVMLMHLTFHR